jgi:hypothetical protein
MRITTVCVAMVLVCSPIAWPQAKSAQLGDFVGTWKADFHKQTWLVLTLSASKDSLTGELTHSVQISADDKGEITSVGDEMSTDKVASVALHASTLHITARDEESNADEYSLILTGSDSADLQAVTASPTGAPKPFHLKRSSPAQK